MADPDKLAQQLQEALAKRRPRPWIAVIVALIVGTLFLALAVWWMYPRPRLEPLQAVALDGIFTPDEKPLARTQLLLPPDDEDLRRLRGQTIVFQELGPLLKPGERPRETIAKSDEHGQAAVEWRLTPGAAMTEFLVRYLNVAERHESLRDGGRLFVWPVEAALFIVDADETLIAEEVDEQARTTLQKVAQEGWKIVYLSLAGTQAADFRVARGWIQRSARLPLGPVLGRPSYPSEESPAEIRREVMKGLQGRFRGPLAAVVKTVQAAQVCKELGVRTYMIGQTAPPAEVVQAPTWADVPVRLK